MISPLLIAALLGSGLFLAAKKAKTSSTVRVWVETEGDYQTPNGERTELTGTVAQKKADILTAFPPGSFLTVIDDMAVIDTEGDFFTDQLLPTAEGQLVVAAINHNRLSETPAQIAKWAENEAKKQPSLNMSALQYIRRIS